MDDVGKVSGAGQTFRHQAPFCKSKTLSQFTRPGADAQVEENSAWFRTLSLGKDRRNAEKYKLCGQDSGTEWIIRSIEGTGMLPTSGLSFTGALSCVPGRAWRPGLGMGRQLCEEAETLDESL